MKIAFNINRLIETELHFAKRFTSVTPKPYGLLYWNEANKISHDSNHAIITDFVGVESAIKDIISFYKAKGITPRLYPSLKGDDLGILSSHLKNHGFIIETGDDQYFLHEKESEIEPVHGIHFEKIKQVTPELRELILSDDHEDFAIKVLERHLRHPGFHLLGGYVNEELVTIASVNIFEGYSRVDDVLTHKFYRGKGYSSAMIHHLVQYHKDHSDNYLYLYSAIPEAIKIYEKAGFVRIPHDFKSWRAHKEL
jgi:GNAT superfamily N-acetyltransferase